MLSWGWFIFNLFYLFIYSFIICCCFTLRLCYLSGYFDRLNASFFYLPFRKCLYLLSSYFSTLILCSYRLSSYLPVCLHYFHIYYLILQCIFTIILFLNIFLFFIFFSYTLSHYLSIYLYYFHILFSDFTLRLSSVFGLIFLSLCLCVVVLKVC